MEKTSHSHESHVHQHGGHNHNYKANKKALTLSFVLIATFMIVEFVGGFLTNSLALISDAGHMLSDAAALGLSLAALVFGAKKATPSKSYGYKRFEILAALLNGLVLIILSIYIMVEAVNRISTPQEVMGRNMMIIAIIGLIINIVVAWILHTQAASGENLNIRSAFMHVIGDLLGSVGAIVAGILIMSFGWYVADPIASIIVSVLVLYSGWNVLKQSVDILMESKPSNIDSQEVTEVLESIEGVEEVHDLHIWLMTSDYPLMTVHLRVRPDIDRDLILESAKGIIHEKFNISHITIQIEGRTLCLPDDLCN